MTRSADQVLQLYRAAHAFTSEILAHARQADWDRVLELGDSYMNVVEQIEQLGFVPPLSEEDRASKYELLLSILKNDAATRELIEPGLQRLSQLIGTMKRQQSLQEAYQPAAATP